MILGAAALCIAAGIAGAQPPFQVQQLQSSQQRDQLQGGASQAQTGESVPALYPGEEKDTGKQVLLGPVMRPQWQWVNVSLDSQYLYTSNALLDDGNKKSAGLLISSVEADLNAPPVTLGPGQLFTQLGYQYQWFNYGLGGANLHTLDFDAATLHADALYQLPDQYEIDASLEYTRLLSEANNYDEVYRELVPTLGLAKSFQLQSNLQLGVDYSADYRITGEPPFQSQSRSANNRTDQSLALTLNWQVAPKVILRPFYRFQYSYYPNYYADHSRTDYLNTVGLSASYCFNSWSSIRIFIDYEILDTNSQIIPDYHKLDAGGGVAAEFKF